MKSIQYESKGSPKVIKANHGSKKVEEVEQIKERYRRESELN